MCQGTLNALENALKPGRAIYMHQSKDGGIKISVVYTRPRKRQKSTVIRGKNLAQALYILWRTDIKEG